MNIQLKSLKLTERYRWAYFSFGHERATHGWRKTRLCLDSLSRFLWGTGPLLAGKGANRWPFRGAERHCAV